MQIEGTDGGIMEGLQSKRPTLQSATGSARSFEDLKLTKHGTTPKTNHIKSQVTNDNHLIHIHIISLSSSTGVTYMCNILEAALI